ncbi:MAG: hypothetical protein H0V29_14130 [Thermoleophilaceae bacterium]|nr:hypothetical protein [Thermoleophilaceae bacterium]
MSTSTDGQPFARAASKWLLMVGYLVLLKPMSATPLGVVHDGFGLAFFLVVAFFFGFALGFGAPGLRHGHGSASQKIPSPSPSRVSPARWAAAWLS